MTVLHKINCCLQIVLVFRIYSRGINDLEKNLNYKNGKVSKSNENMKSRGSNKSAQALKNATGELILLRNKKNDYVIAAIFKT